MSSCFRRLRTWTGWLSAAWILTPGIALAEGPTIQHEPINMAMENQPISILAKVNPGSAPVQSVVLHYSQSRDASPIKQLMTPTGDDMYVATIPAQHLGGAPTVYYYIEVIDRSEEWAETTWHQVQIRREVTGTPPPVAPPVTSTPAVEPSIITHDARPTQPPVQVDGSRPQKTDDSDTMKWIAGGALAAGAAVAIVAAADSGGGGGGGSTPPPMDMDDGTDTNMTDTVVCTSADVTGIWQSPNPSAPGFQLSADFSAQFFTAPGEPLDPGSWRLADCMITLSPSSNNAYQGTGTLSDDKTTLDLNGIPFVKTN